MRTTSPFEDKILSLVEPQAAHLGYRVVRVRLMGAKRKTIQIMAERASDGGMDVEDCARLSRAAGAALEAADPLADPYSLEVSSPGIDRPLVALADFDRFLGHEAKIELDRLAEGRKRFRGQLAGTDGAMVGLDLPGEAETVFVPFAWIKEARLVLTDALIEESLKARSPNAAQGAPVESDDPLLAAAEQQSARKAAGKPGPRGAAPKTPKTPKKQSHGE